MNYCVNPEHVFSGGALDGILSKQEVNEGFTYCLRCRAKGFKDPMVKR